MEKIIENYLRLYIPEEIIPLRIYYSSDNIQETITN
jgi:hypothetical protein